MTADILQFFPRGYSLGRLGSCETATLKIADLPNLAAAPLPESIPYKGQGIDGMFTDTSCSEMNPDQDS
jgi:hypothetical protein